MRHVIRVFLVGAIVAFGAGPVAADVQDSRAPNAQEGDNETSSSQGGASESGDAVAGQVVGIVASGDTSVDATNVSQDVDVESGDATAENQVATFTGQNAVLQSAMNSADITGVTGINIQEGDNETDYSQSADAASGDAVGGQVIGAVTAAGGSAEIVAANTSMDVDVETGDATADNHLCSFVGQNYTEDDTRILAGTSGQPAASDITAPARTNTTVCGSAGSADRVNGQPTFSDIVDVFALNVQEGDNDLTSSQDAAAATGDGVAGQVIGAVSAGDASIDATNTSEDVDIETGDADATNAQAVFVGQNVSDDLLIGIAPAANGVAISAADIDDVLGGINVQEGDNSADLSQAADAASGDGVGGQVIGAVTSAGGSADIVADNTSEDVDVETGDALADNANAAFVGQNVSDTLAIGGGVLGEGAAPSAASGADINDVSGSNIQEGDNDLDGSQDASATTGDGVAGQVLGVVSAGDASVDATNVSEDVDVETGEATADNDAASFVGQNKLQTVVTVGLADITNSRAFVGNLQEGDNERDFGQSADAASGDAVGGQVTGVVTSAGGSADAVLDNTSEDVNLESGEAQFANDDRAFVGQNVSAQTTIIVILSI